MTDEELLAAWLRKCDELTALKAEVQELHREVQDRQIGPYSPDAAVCHIELEATDG